MQPVVFSLVQCWCIVALVPGADRYCGPGPRPRGSWNPIWANRGQEGGGGEGRRRALICSGKGCWLGQDTTLGLKQ